MDVFLGLWTRAMACGVDHRSWILGALEGVLQQVMGGNVFASFQDGKYCGMI